MPLARDFDPARVAQTLDVASDNLIVNKLLTMGKKLDGVSPTAFRERRVQTVTIGRERINFYIGMKLVQGQDEFTN